MDTVAAHERSLAVRLWTALEGVPGLEMLAQWPRDRGSRRRRGLHARRLPRPAAGRDPQRRARDRRAPRLLLRASADDPSARASRRPTRAACTPSCAPAAAPSCRVPCARASGSARRWRTSTGSSGRCTRSPPLALAPATCTIPRTTSIGDPRRGKVRPRRTDHVYKTVEITGSSPEGVTQAIDRAIAKASETVRNLDWFQVTEIRGQIADAQGRPLPGDLEARLPPRRLSGASSRTRAGCSGVVRVVGRDEFRPG